MSQAKSSMPRGVHFDPIVRQIEFRAPSTPSCSPSYESYVPPAPLMGTRELPENDHYDAQAAFAPALGPQPLPETEIAAIPDQRIAYRPGKVVPVDVSTGIDLAKRYGADQTRPASNPANHSISIVIPFHHKPSVIVMEGAVTIGKLMQALTNALSGKVHLLKGQTDFVGFEIHQDGKWEAKFQR